MRDYFLVPKEMAAYTRMSEYTIRKWCREGKFRATKIGKEWRIPIVELRRIYRDLPLELWEEIAEDRYKGLGGLESARMRIDRRRKGLNPQTGSERK